MKRLILMAAGFLLLTVFLGACKSQPKKLVANNKDPELARQVAAEYTGEVPCADCEAIEFRLNIKPDFTYESSKIYKGKSEEPFVESGNYAFTADSILVLMTATPGMNYFKIIPAGLGMLDLEGKEIVGALADKYKLAQMSPGGKMELMQEAEGTPNPEFLMKLAGEGIDFYARGNEPFWSLDLDFEKVFRFSTMDGDELNTPPTEPAMAQDAPVSRYAAETEAGAIILTIMKGKCFDNMSGERFSHKVRVEYKKGAAADYTSFEGCGRYVPDYGLAGTWTLTALDGQPVDAAQWEKGAPQLIMDPAAMRVSGHNSCNTLNGSFEMEKNAIVFGPLASTMMACPNMEMEKTFNQLISGHQLKYELAGNQLTLTHPGGKTLAFAKEK